MNTSRSEVRATLLRGAALAGLLAALLSPPAWGQESHTTDVGTIDKETVEKVFPSKRPYSPWAGRSFPTRPLFGDTHTHSSFSMMQELSALGWGHATHIGLARVKR